MNHLLGEWAWLIWALVTITFLGGTLTLSLCLNPVRAQRWMCGLIISGVFFTVAFALVGMQAGVRPFIQPVALLSWIRLFVLIGSVVGLASLARLWWKRRSL